MTEGYIRKNDLRISGYTDGDYFISIDSKDFFGKAISSPSGKYLIASHKKDLVVVDHRKNELVYEYIFKGNLSSFDLLITDDLYFIVIDIGNAAESYTATLFAWAGFDVSVQYNMVQTNQNTT